MSTTRRRWITIALVFLLAYLASYLAFRTSHIEKWDRDGHDYVIFPSGSSVLYYAFRPLTWLDARLTGMRFHIGPHR